MVSLRLHVLGLVAMAGMLAAGCKDKTPVTLASDDAQVHLTVPADMTATTGLNPQAGIQAANVRRGLYAIVISTAKPDDVSLIGMAEQVRSNVQHSLINASLTAAKSVKINGMDALQFTAEGRPPDATTTVTYLVTVVESARNYHQVMAWAPADEFDRVRATLEQVVNSFQAADGPAQTAAPVPVPAAGGAAPHAVPSASGPAAGGSAPQPAQQQ